MAYFEGTVYSQTLHMDTHLAAVLPQDSRFRRMRQTPAGSSAGERAVGSASPLGDPAPRVLLLLHGLGDCGANWITRTNAARYAEEHDLALLIPDVQKSFYQDMVFGERYFTYVTEELPELAEALFGLKTDPEHLGVAGFSMGGYGALRCALTYPERYFACGAFSSACRIEDVLFSALPDDPSARGEARIAPAAGYENPAKALFGDLSSGQKKDPGAVTAAVPKTSDLFYLAERLADTKTGAAPFALRLYMTCGDEDPLLPGSRDLAKKIPAGLFSDLSFDVRPGIHEWGFWDEALRRFFGWIG